MDERYIPTEETESSGRNPELLFGVVDNVGEEIAALNAAIAERDFDAVLERYNDLQLLEAAVLQKGPNGEYLNGIVRGVEQVVSEISGAELTAADAETVDRVLKETGLNPVAFAETGNALYHLQRYGEADALLERWADAQLPALVQANMHNARASVAYKQDRVSDARTLNREAMAILQSDVVDSTDPNLRWQELKLRHGLIYDRIGEGKVFDDMVDQFLDIRAARADMGDVLHVGRTDLEIGRLLVKLGRDEEALVYAAQAVSALESHGYVNAALQAYELIGDIRGQMGEDGRAQRVWARGVDFGEQRQADFTRELPELRERAETGMKIPAACLIDIGDDHVVVERFETDKGDERFLLPVVDQERSKKADATVRKKVAALLNHLLYTIDAETAMADPIALSQRKTAVFRRHKERDEDGNRRVGFKIAAEIRQLQDALKHDSSLDKLTQERYTIMSFADMADMADQFDDLSQRVIESEQAWREKDV